MIIVFNRNEFEVIHIRSKISFSFFIKNYISANHNLLIIWIVQFASFRIVVITNEDKLFTFTIQLGFSLVWYIYIDNASKNSQVRDTQVSSIPCFLCHFFPHTSCQSQVEYVDYTCISFNPKLFRQSLTLEHASGHVKNRSLLSCCNTILLGRSWNCQRAPNSICFIKLYEFFGSKLYSSIGSHGFNLVSTFFIHYNFELFKSLKNF